MTKLWAQFKFIFIMAVVILAFVVVGMFQSSDSIGVSKAASVNGEIISAQTIYRALDNQGEQAQGELRQFFTSFILNRLITEEVLSQDLRSKNVFIPDTSIRDQISNIPAFQNKQGFDYLRYQGYLRQVGQTAQTFESELRKQLLLRATQKVFATAFVSPQIQKKLAKKLQSTHINISYLKFKKSDLSSDPQKSEKIFQSLSSQVQKNKQASILKTLKKKKWLKSGKFSLQNSSQSVLGKNQRLIRTLLEKTPLGRVHSEIIASEGLYYIAKIGKINQEKKKQNPIRQSKAFESYIALLRQQADIKINSAFTTRQTP